MYARPESHAEVLPGSPSVILPGITLPVNGGKDPWKLFIGENSPDPATCRSGECNPLRMGIRRHRLTRNRSSGNTSIACRRRRGGHSCAAIVGALLAVG